MSRTVSGQSKCRLHAELARLTRAARPHVRHRSAPGSAAGRRIVARVRGGGVVVRACVAGSDETEADAQDVWDRAQLLGRKLDLAVSEEDYTAAASLRDERAKLMSNVSQRTQHVLEAVEALRTGDTSEERAQAISSLKDAGDQRCLPALFEALCDPNAAISEAAESTVWEMFCQSGDPQVDAQLVEGMVAMKSPGTWSAAEALFTRVIQAAPEFAEGYNKRATVMYMRHDYTAAIKDCKTTVELQPSHFGAYSGMGLCYIAINDLPEAMKCLRKALALNPRLDQIRSYLVKLEGMVDSDE